MTRIVRLTLVLVILSAAAGGMAADTRPPALDRVVRVNVWGGELGDVVQEIKNQTGVDVIMYPPDFAAARPAPKIYLVSGGVTVRTVLECLARRLAFRYRLSNTGRVEISKSYDWAVVEPALRFSRLDALAAGAAGDLDAVRRFLGEIVKPLSLLHGDYSITLERSPSRIDPNSIRAVLALPPVLADYLDRAIVCLSGEPGDARGARSHEPRNFAVAWPEPPDWENLLTRRVSAPFGGDLRTILADVCEQARVAIILQAPPAQASGQPLSSGPAGLGRVTEELAARYNLGRRIFLAVGALAFEPGPGGGWEADPRIRELFWSGLAVGGFDARNAAAHAGGGAALTETVRRRVFPWLWRDPACAVVYSEASGRLAVVAPVNVMESVAACLAELERGGDEKAMRK